MCEEESSGAGGAEAPQEVARVGDSLLCRSGTAGVVRGENLMWHTKNASRSYQMTVNSRLALPVNFESEKCSGSNACETRGNGQSRTDKVWIER